MGAVRILGLDPSSTSFGYGVIDARADGIALDYVEAGHLTAPARLTKYRRLVEIGTHLEELVAEFKPDVVALEAGFVKGQMGALVSGAARGVAAYICARGGLEVYEYAPATVKQAVTTAGNADKASVARMVQLLLRLNTPPQADAADALAVAIAHARRPPGKAPV